MARTGTGAERGRIRRGAGLLAAAMAVSLSACAGGGRPGTPASEADRLEVLTQFTLALSQRDFDAAASLLVREESARLKAPDGAVREEMKDRLRAIRKTTLVRNPMVTVEGGKIRGIYDLLPVLDQDTSAAISAIAAISAADLPPPAPEEARAQGPAIDTAAGDAALRDLSGKFFQSIQTRNWKKALAMLDPRERQAFLRGDGGVKEAARRRLLEIDTSAWQALSIEDGKLAGVVLIIPGRAPEAPDAAGNRGR